jgi:hypothetical protein
MTIILHPDGHAEIECDEGKRIVADGSGKKLTEREAEEIMEALIERTKR